MEEVGGSSEGCCTILELNIDALHFMDLGLLSLYSVVYSLGATS